MPLDQSAPRPSHRSLRISGLIAVLVAAGLVTAGITSRARSNEELVQWTQEQAVPSVSVIAPGDRNALATLDLPGRFEAYTQAPIYARVSGYLKNWKVDIGAQVKAGQLMAEIETPDLDQQLLQARADLATAKANAELAHTTAERWQAMLKTDAVSRQEVDDRVGESAARDAMLQAAQANLDRLLATKAFARIVAPFDGTVTSRETDVGALINAGGGSGPALFEVADTRKLRLYVNVPQNYVASVKPGTKADITVPGHADKTYTATVVSSSRAIDAASGTTLVQLQVDNRSGELLPGGFANVSLHLPGDSGALSVPSSALIFGKEGLHVAVVDDAGKAALKPVAIARDLGKTIELRSGIAASDRIIESPPDGLVEGTAVRVVEPAQPTAGTGH